MKKISKKLLLLTLLLIPSLVFASNGNVSFPIIFALAMEAFVSIHMSVFVLKPLSELLSTDNSKKIFWILFIIRICFLLFCDLFVTTNVALMDFFAVFIGGFTIFPIWSIKKNLKPGKTENIRQTSTLNQPSSIKGIELKCSQCNAPLQITDKYCSYCGTPFDGNNVIVSQNESGMIKLPTKTVVLPSKFDAIYNLSEDKMLEKFIEKELNKVGIDSTTKLIPNDILKRKKVFNSIFSLLTFVFITLIFFHFPIYTYIIGLILLFIFFIVTRKYDLIKYLKKEIKARPSEKISNIIMNVKNTFVSDNSKIDLLIGLLLAITIPLIIFSSPRIIYEKVDGGYAVRYYAFGLTNYKTANIPETYKNEKVVSLRGNTFSNMPFLESVNLPDSITEIRGQAFKNCYKLVEVNIPKSLEYLGGGAFYNAISIKDIELPDTLTYLGGEAFYNATSLERIKLSNNLTEIRGNTFENCSSLKNITIPDEVTRIGGHAFYGATSLNEVVISANSKLNEIGSSAFRKCDSLYNITLPTNTYVNEKAFKESPTNINRYNKNCHYIDGQYNCEY